MAAVLNRREGREASPAPAGDAGAAPVLEFNISAWYREKQVLDTVTGELRAGEILSLVGLSGSGKSTLALAVLGLLRFRGGRAAGSIRLCGKELCGAGERELRSVRGRLAGYVPQNAAAALNPKLRIRTLLEETWRAHANGSPPRGFRQELLESVQLPGDEDFLARRAGELSTGQGQRLLIALAIMHAPEALIADEPTSALDAITQAAILDLFRELNRRKGIAMLFISHDLASVASISARVSILHEHRVVETGSAQEIFTAPRHPFTRQLAAAAARTSVFNRPVPSG